MFFLIYVGIGFVLIALLLLIIFVLKGTSEKSLEKTMTKYSNAAVKAQHNIINNNKDILKETADATADIHKDAVKNITHSIKEGLSDDEKQNKSES